MNVEEPNQIMDVDTDGINFPKLQDDKRFRVRLQNQGNGIEDKPGMLNGDL